MPSTANKGLYPLSEIVKLAQANGVDFGDSSPENRIRYYIRFGLLPNAKRKSFNGGSPSAAFSLDVVDKIVKIEKLRNKGLSVYDQQKLLQSKSSPKEAPSYEQNLVNYDPVTIPAEAIQVKPTQVEQIQPALIPMVTNEPNTEFIEPEPSRFRFAKTALLRSAAVLATFLLLLLFGLNFHNLYHYFKTSNANKGGQNISGDLPSLKSPGQTLAASSPANGYLWVNVPTDIKSLLTVHSGINTDNTDVNAGTGKLTASNVVYDILPGGNISISGDPQNPVISSTAGKVTGTTNRITVSGSTVNISSNYVGQTSINTVGTLTTGTWQASQIGIAYINGGACAAGQFVESINGALGCAFPPAGGNPDFSQILTGTNTGQTLTVGNGSSLVASGTGVIRATEFVGSGSTTAAVDLATAEVSGSLADGNISDTLTIGAGSSVSATAVNSGTLGNAAVTLALASFGSITGTLADGNVSDTLTVGAASSVSATAINSGTLGNAGVTLALGSFGSITGTLADANVSDTLTASIFIGSGSTTNAVDLATAEVNGTLGIANGGTGAATSQAAINNLSQLTTEGDLLYHNGTNSTRLPRGSNGNCLTSNATTIVWGSCAAAGSVTASGVQSANQVAFFTGDDILDGSNNFTWDGSTLSVTGAITLSSTLTANGDVAIGNAATDALTITSEIRGASPLTFEGATNDNIYTIFAIADPTSSSKTITFPDETGTVCTTGSVCTGYQAAGSYVTSVSGTLNRITSTGGTTPVIDISASYVGQASITTLGTITTGVWNGTTIAIANGGTGAVTSQAAINNLSQLTTNGDLLYHNGTNSTRLARGSDATCLKSDTTTILWGSCAAAGTVTAPGTQTANQVAYFTADDTLAGDNNFTWDSGTGELALGGDTNLYRESALTLGTDSNFSLDNTAAANNLIIGYGDFNSGNAIRFRNAGGNLDAGIYQANDDDLYLRAGNDNRIVLVSDGNTNNFEFDTSDAGSISLVFGAGFTTGTESSTVYLNSGNGGGQPTILFGSNQSYDTNLYRSAASTLKTDGSLQVGTLASASSTALCANGSNTLATCTANANSVTLQQAYDASSNPEITLDATRGALTLRDNATPLGANLFEVQSNGGGTTYFGITSSGTSVGSGLAYSGSGAVTVSSGGAGQLSLDSASGTIQGASGDSLQLTGVSNFLVAAGQGLDTSAAGTLDIAANTATLIKLNTDTDASLSGTENFRIFNSGVTDSGFNVADIFATYNAATSVAEQYVLSVANADDGGSTGVPDALINVANTDTNEAVAIGIRFFASAGGITTGIDLTDTDIGTGISLGANDISGTTAVIDFSNFDVATSGNITVAAGQGLDTNAAGALNIGTANVGANTIAIGPAGATAATIDFVGGSGATGCSIAGNTGNLTCSGTVTGSGAVGYWTLSGDAIQKATAANKVELLYGDAGDTQLKIENTTNSVIPTVDSTVINLTGNTTGIVTDGVDALSIAAEFGNGTTNTNSGIHIDIDPVNSPSGDETFNALLIDGITSSSATENALNIGTGWDNSIFFATDSTHTIKVQDQDTAATAGSALSITGAAGNTTGAGGNIALSGGNGGTGGATGGAGGGLTFSAGTGANGSSSTGGNAGTFTFSASNGGNAGGAATNGGNGSSVAITGGNGGTASTGTTGSGGSFTFVGGNAGALTGVISGGPGGNGGSFTVTGGTGTDTTVSGGLGGAVTLAGGTGGGYSNGGALTLSSGAGGSGVASGTFGGAVSISTGSGSSTSGSITISTAASQIVGSINITGGTSTLAGSGAVNINGGGNDLVANGGAINLTTANASQVHTSGRSTTNTTSSAFVYTANSLTTGTGMYLSSSSLTSGILANLNLTSVSSGSLTTTGLQINTTISVANAAGDYVVNSLDLAALAGTGCTGGSVTSCRANAININGFGLAQSKLTTTALNIADQYNATGTHYGICFDCDGTYSDSQIANGITWGSDGGRASLYRGTSDQIYIAVNDSLRLASDGTGGRILLGTSDDLGFYRQEDNMAGVYSATSTLYSATALTLANSTYSTLESNGSGLSFFRGTDQFATLRTAKNEYWRLDDNGTFNAYKNNLTNSLIGNTTQWTFLNLNQAYGLNTSTDIKLNSASGKFTQVWAYDGVSAYTDVTTPANDSKIDASFTIAADSNDVFYFTQGTTTDTYEWEYIINNPVSFSDPGAFAEVVEYSSGANGGGDCNTWTGADYVATWSFSGTGYDYLSANDTALSCKVNGVSGKWYRVRFPSHNFTGGAITAYSFSPSIKTGNLVDLKVDNSSVFTIDNSGYIQNDLTIGAKTDSQPHAFESNCSCLTNSAAGTWASGDTNRDAAFSSAVFKGRLYVATKETNAAAIYRYDRGTTWTQVSSSTDGNISGTGDSTAVDAIVLTVYDGRLYAGTQTGSGAALGAIYSTSDGTTWTEISSATEGTIGGDASIDGVSDFTVWNGRLYVATQDSNTGAIYRMDGSGTNSNSFTRLNATLGKGLAEATADIDEGRLISYEGRLWWGTVTGNSTARLYAWDGNAMTLINTTAGTFTSGTTGVDDVTSLAVYNGQLFVGTKEADLANIYSYKSGVPAVAGADIFLKTTATSGRIDASADTTDVDTVPVMRVYNGRLWAGSGTGASTGAIYYYDGISAWTKINTTRGTFGAQSTVQQVDVLQDYNGTLYVGTDTSNIGSIYSFVSTSGNSYSLRFDSNLVSTTYNYGQGNFGTISFAGNQSGQGSAAGSFIVNAPINSVSGSFDYAEDYPTFDTSLSQGDIVAVDPVAAEHVKKASHQESKTSLIGIVTTDPGFTLGSKTPLEGGDHYEPVALVGRVPLKVSSENGPIKPGDLITLSSIPGVGAKAVAGSPIIGKALEPYDNTDTSAVKKIIVFVQNSPPADGNLANDPIWSGKIKFDEEDNTVATLSAGKSWKFVNSMGGIVASINDLGEAVFSKVTTPFASITKLVFGEAAVKKDSGSAGESKIEAGKTEVLVETDKVQADSIISITPNSEPNGVLYIKEKIPGKGFVVAIKQSSDLSTETKFSWLLINQD